MQIKPLGHYAEILIIVAIIAEIVNDSEDV